MRDKYADEGGFHIFDDALPNPIRLRHLIGAGLSTEIIFTILFAVGLLITGHRFDYSVGKGLIIAGRIGTCVVIGFWLVPLASCVLETIALRRITPGALYKVTPAFNATYGFPIAYGIYLLLRNRPPVAHYLHAHTLEGWHLYAALAVVGFGIAWIARMLLMANYGKPFSAGARSLYDMSQPPRAAEVPYIEPYTREEIEQTAPLTVPRFFSN